MSKLKLIVGSTEVTAYRLKGLKIKVGQYHFRVWKNGFEYGNRFGGRLIFFPWRKK